MCFGEHSPKPQALDPGVGSSVKEPTKGPTLNPKPYPYKEVNGKGALGFHVWTGETLLPKFRVRVSSFRARGNLALGIDEPNNRLAVATCLSGTLNPKPLNRVGAR